jgi:hypothetical protein
MGQTLSIALLALFNLCCWGIIAAVKNIHLSRRKEFVKKTVKAIQNPGNSEKMLEAYDAFRTLALWPKHGLIAVVWAGQVLMVFMRNSELLSEKDKAVVRLFMVFDFMTLFLCLLAGILAIRLTFHPENKQEKA